MIDKALNSSWYTTLSKKVSLITNKPNIFDVDDFYRRPPYFRFRFKNYDKESAIYKDLGQLIISFAGNLKWVMITRDQTQNYVIIPELFADSFSDSSTFDEEHMTKKYGHKYFEYLDKAVEDVSSIAELLEHW